MRHLPLPLPALLAAALLLGCPQDDDDFSPGDDDAGDDDAGDDDSWDPRFDALVDAIHDDLDANIAPGVSVAVLEGGAITFAHGFGSARNDEQVDVTPETLFQVGSTTKMMTTAALLQKVQAGDVALDDTLEQLLPELEFALGPTWDDQLRVEHLITHQGAFYDWTNWDGSSDDGDLAAHTYGFFADNLYLMAPPGEFWNYSNPNFSLAGLVTEEHDTRAWPDILVEDVWQPLGMDRTFARKSEVLADGDYAEGFGPSVYDYDNHAVSMDEIQDAAWLRPAGLAWSTPSQMVRFAGFLIDGNPAVLDDGLRQQMVSEQVDTEFYADEIHYGYGVFVDRGIYVEPADYYAMPIYEHGGNTLAFSSILYAVPDHDFAISILSSGRATDFTHTLDVAVTTLLDLPSPTAPPEFPWDPAGLDDHVGTYLDPFNVGEMIVTRQGDTLYVELPLLDQLGYAYTTQMDPVSTDIWYVTIDGYPYDLTFRGASPGGSSQYASNRMFVATRSDGRVAPQAVTATQAERLERMLQRARLDPLPPPRSQDHHR